MEWHTSLHSFNTTKWSTKKKIHLDQKASQPSNTKYNEIQLRSIIFKMLQKCKIQNKWQVHLGVTSILLVTYIYIERGELGYSVNGINNKGVAWMISEIFIKLRHITSCTKSKGKSSLSNKSFKSQQLKSFKASKFQGVILTKVVLQMLIVP